MPSLTNFLTDKTSTFKYKCNKIVKQHYLELWTKQAHKFALIYRNEEGTGLVLTVLQDWCFFMHSQKKFTELQV
jgi:hypothetical protein